VTLCLYLSPGGFPTVEVDGRPVQLTRHQTRIMMLLASDADVLFYMEDFYAALWGANGEEPLNAANVVNVMICKLRKILGPDAIKTGPAAVRRFNGFISPGRAPRGHQLGPSVRVFSILEEIPRAPGC